MRRFRIVCAAMMILVPAAAFARQAPRVPNAVPYHVTAPVARGPAGDATVYTRALIAKDGVSTVEIATAPFGVPASTPITNVQVRALKPSGAVAFVRNFTEIRRGTLVWPFGDLVIGQALNIDVHVDDDTVPRTDVALLQDVVRRRPDLRVTALKTPQPAVTNVPAAIIATVDEHNGDAGARATCALIVDGAEVDRLDNMWVDAGDAVSCAFTYTFGSEGTHSVRVAVTNVDPWDWDDSNNAFDASVQVARPFDVFDSFYIAAAETTETQWGYHKSSYIYAGNGEDYLSQRNLSRWRQSVEVQAFVTHRWSFPIAAVDVVASDETGTRVSLHLTDIAATSSSNYPGHQFECGWRRDGTGDVRFVDVYICSTHDSIMGDWSFLSVLQNDGKVTYTSLGYDRTWSGDPDNVTGYYYYVNETFTDGSGELVPFGSNLFVTATITSGGFFDGAQAALALGEPTTTGWENPLFCGVDNFSWGSISFCTEYHDVIVGRFKVVVGGNWP